MNLRPHMVSQTRLYPVERLKRSAATLARHMGSPYAANDVRVLVGYSRVLIRLMKIILDLTRCNDCFTARHEGLASPHSRRTLTETLGGAPALLKWRRKHIWNKGRLAAIADGTYRPAPEYESRGESKQDAPQKSPRSHVKNAGTAPVRGTASPAFFRLPVLQNLNAQRRCFTHTGKRGPAKAWFPSIILWPHELDGQYVPDFKSAARQPAGSEFHTAAPASGHPGHEASPAQAPAGTSRAPP